MKRIALLVGAPCLGKAHPTELERTFTASVSNDIYQMYHFLRSPMGGAWDTRQEIQVLQDPSPQEFRQELDRTQFYDYRLFYFAGHGNATHIQINTHDLMSIATTQLPMMQKQLRIFDSCRDEVMQTGGGLGDNVLIDLADRRYRQDELRAARWLFKSTLQSLPQGGTTSLYACRHGSRAKGTNKGGYFTSSLIRVALETAQRQNKITLTDEIFSQVQQRITEQTDGEQIPDIEFSYHKMPFSISENAIQQSANQILRQMQHEGQGMPTWGKILLGMSGLAALAYFIAQANDD